MTRTIRRSHDVMCPRCDQEITIVAKHSDHDCYDHEVVLCDLACPLCQQDFDQVADERVPLVRFCHMIETDLGRLPLGDLDPRDYVPASEG